MKTKKLKGTPVAKANIKKVLQLIGAYIEPSEYIANVHVHEWMYDAKTGEFNLTVVSDQTDPEALENIKNVFFLRTGEQLIVEEI